MLPERIDGVTLDVGGVLTLPPLIDLLHTHGISATVDDLLVAHHAGVAVEDALLATAEGAVVDALGPERHAYYRALATAIGAPAAAHASLIDALAEMATRELPWTLAVPGALQLIGDLNRVGVPVAVVSNSNGTVEAQLRTMGICQTGPGPLPRVEIVVDSAVVGVRKPHPEIFDPAVTALGIERSSIVHVGDTVAFDVAAAGAAGVAAVHFDASGTCTGTHAHISRLADLVDLPAPRS